MVRVPESMTANEFLCGDFTPAQKRIAELEAEVERLREVCRILVAQWETRYRMENAALWEQELYAQARAALEIKE